VRRLVVVAHLVRSMTRGACDMARQHAMTARGDARVVGWWRQVVPGAAIAPPSAVSS
jgi:hypothetical protein